MMEAAKKLPMKYATAVREALVERWFDVDPTAAEAWMRTQPDDDRAWKAWAGHFPERAIAEVHENPRGAGAKDLLQVAIRALPGITDAKAKAENLLGLPSDPARDTLLGNAVADWAIKDPDGAFAFAHQLPLGEGRNHATGDALKEIAKKDPFRAMQMANEMLPEYSQANVADVPAQIASETAKRDFAAAARWVEQMPAEMRRRVAFPIALNLVQTDPVRALEWGSANSVDFNGSILPAAMRKNSAETLRWIEAKPEGPDRDKLLEAALGSSTLGGDSVRFNSELAQLPPESRLRVAENLGGFSGGAENAKRTWAWIATLDDESARLAAIRSASARVAIRARWNPDQPVQTPEFSDAASRDAVLLGKAQWSNPVDAAEGLLQISDPQTQQNAFDRYMPDWLHRDPAKTEAWLKQNGSFSQEQIDGWKEAARWVR
jgi:hypothetical protein